MARGAEATAWSRRCGASGTGAAVDPRSRRCRRRIAGGRCSAFALGGRLLRGGFGGCGGFAGFAPARFLRILLALFGQLALPLFERIIDSCQVWSPWEVRWIVQGPWRLALPGSRPARVSWPGRAQGVGVSAIAAEGPGTMRLPSSPAADCVRVAAADRWAGGRSRAHAAGGDVHGACGHGASGQCSSSGIPRLVRSR